MRTALIALTAVELLAVVAALVAYLARLLAALRVTADRLGKVAFGVRAIETQCRSIGPAVTQLNTAVSELSEGLAALAELAERRAAS
jgi:hypothetical protein